MNKQTRDFLDYLLRERKYSPKTVQSYRFDIEKFFDFLLKEKRKLFPFLFIHFFHVVTGWIIGTS